MRTKFPSIKLSESYENKISQGVRNFHFCRQLGVCILVPCTLYTVHCTCSCTCTCAPVLLCTCACTYTCTCTCPQVHVPHLRYLQHLSSCRYLDNNVYSLDRVTALHRVTIVLAGSLQGGDRGRLNEPNGVPWTSKSTSQSGPTGRKSKLT